MPTYCYRVREGRRGCSTCEETFEVVQAMDEPRLSRCPRCDAEVESIIRTCNFVRGFTTASLLSRERLKKSGLRKLQRDDGGNYVDTTEK